MRGLKRELAEEKVGAHKERRLNDKLSRQLKRVVGEKDKLSSANDAALGRSMERTKRVRRKSAESETRLRRTQQTVADLRRKLNASKDKVRVLIYSGDTDPCINTFWSHKRIEFSILNYLQLSWVYNNRC